MTKPRRDKVRGEAGFTLIEVIVVLAILGLLVGGLGAGLMSTWRNDDATLQRLAKSHDAQLTASYFVNDAQSSGAGGVSLQADPSTTCPDPSVAGSLTEVLRMAWTDTSGSATPTTISKTVNYVLVTDTTNAIAMMRRYCVNGTLSSDTTVGHYVASATASCAPSPADCTGTPQTVTLSVIETKGSSEPQPYAYSLTGDFRQVPPNGSTPTLPPAVPWLTLGPDSACDPPASTTIAAGAQLTVKGGGTIVSNGSIAGTTPPGTPTLHNPTPPNFVPDPYRALPAPSTSGLRSFSDGDLNHGPGVYTAPVNVTGSVKLDPGIYILDAGLSVSDGGKITPEGRAGAMLYLQGGAYTVSSKATVSLSAMTSGPYQGVVIFQARDNPATLMLGGPNSTYAGLVYAPDAPVSIAGDNSSISALIAGCGLVSGNGVTVDPQLQPSGGGGQQQGGGG